jgi:predicted DNA-binding transcriptional regulator YafY
MGDKSVKSAFTSALHKIKSVLNEAERDHLENLDDHVGVFLRSRYEHREQGEFPDHFLTEIQSAIARHEVLNLNYSSARGETSVREVEPVAIYYYSLAWHLIGWCHMRKEYRNFRSDRIITLTNTGKKFRAHNKISLDEYFNTQVQANPNLIRAVVVFKKEVIRGERLYGSVAQEDLGDTVRCEFLLDSLDYMSRWLLMFGNGVIIESPPVLKEKVADLSKALFQHHFTGKSEPQLT